MLNIRIKLWMIVFLLPHLGIAGELWHISGVVSDSTDGEELAGANVQIEGTVIGASTSLNGSFFIDKIEPGTYILTVSYLGYKSQKTPIKVLMGRTSSFNIKLKPEPFAIGAVLVESERVYSTASSNAVRKFDIKTRPARSAQEMIQMVPGVFIAQHAGGGKAEQIFIRGFDADHGTDVSIAVDGLPTNMVSHGHGQGYADLHYLIPDIVEDINVFKGPYFAPFGNLATAGAIRFKTKEHISENVVRFEKGAFNSSRVTTLLQIPAGNEHQNAYIAGQFYKTDGPAEDPQNFDRFNIFGKFHTHLSENSKLLFSATAFSSGWDASGQIPERAVKSGKIGRFGSLDNLEGGTTSRQDLNLQYIVNSKKNSELLIQSYATNYNFKLYSDFTFFLNNPVLGDMIEQVDKRQVAGLNSRYKFTQRIGPSVAVYSFGAGYRSDDIKVSLWESPNRERNRVMVDSDIFERNLFLWAQSAFILSSQFRFQLGLRQDYLTYNVNDHLDVPGFSNGLPHASGYAQESITNPKLSIAYSPFTSLDIFVNAGSGFHSNDARNVVISKKIATLSKAYQQKGFNPQQVDSILVSKNFNPAQNGVSTLPRAIGAEIGFRKRFDNGINLAVAAWWMELEQEFVYIGDRGTTELSDPTRRVGIDLEVRSQIFPWLWADTDLNISQGQIIGAPKNNNFIALAPRLTMSGGLTIIHPSGIDASLRVRHIGSRPANSDNSVVAKGYTIANLSASYRYDQFKITMELENLLDTEWNEAQFDTESRLFDETEPVSEIHFTPGNPRNFRLGLSVFF